MSGDVATVLIEPVLEVVEPVERLAPSTYAAPSDCVVVVLVESDGVVELDFVIVRKADAVVEPESDAEAEDVAFVRNELARAGAVVCAA